MKEDYKIEVIKGISQKTGEPYKCLECTVYTSVGPYTFRDFPSPLEMSVIERTLSKSKEIYGPEENSDNLF